MDTEPLTPLEQQNWDARLETGVATIDLQHKVLFDLLLRTREANMRGHLVDLDQLLQQLRAYAGYHFRHEEDWLRQHVPQHADSAAHIRQHAGFLKRLEQLEQQHQRGTLYLQPVLGFLSHWLMDHILRQDVPLIRPRVLPDLVDTELAVQRGLVGDEDERRLPG